MDDPGLCREASERALSGLRRVNRLLLAALPVRRVLLPRLVAGPARQTLLDLGTGGGDVADALRRAAGRRGVTLTVVGLDRKLSHLLVGRRWGTSQLRVVALAGALPFREGSCDWALSTLFFHHFGLEENRRILREMRRVARRGALIVDLRRSRLARLLARLLLPLLRIGPVASHDGRLSVDQAWDLGEVAELLRDQPIAELRRRFPCRFSMVVTPAEPERSA